MNYLLDTGILLVFMRRSNLAIEINKRYQPLILPNISVISVVSIGELKSLAIRNNWGNRKTKLPGDFLKRFGALHI